MISKFEDFKSGKDLNESRSFKLPRLVKKGDLDGAVKVLKDMVNNIDTSDEFKLRKIANGVEAAGRAIVDIIDNRVNESVNYDDVGYRNKSINSEDDLISVINSFDWGYEMSDSNSTYNRGNRVKDAVSKYIKDKRIKVEKLKPRLSEKGIEVVDRYFK